MLGDSGRAGQSGGRLHQLDSIRGIASLAVVFSHCLIILRQDATLPAWAAIIIDGFNISPLSGLAAGLPAVLLFFVLSGFALTQMIHGKALNYPAYVVKRVARIWLPYLASIALSLLIISTLGWPGGPFVGRWLEGVSGHAITLQDTLWHILLIGPFEAHYNFVTWTLSHEMRISLVFPLVLKLIAGRRIKSAMGMLMALSAAAIGATYTAKYFKLDDLANLLTSLHYILFFGVGALMALHRQTLRQYYGGLSTSARYALYGLALLSYTYPSLIRGLDEALQKFPMLVTHWAMAPGVAIIMAAAICEPGLQKFLCTPALSWLGKVSYSLYLFHGIILIAACHLATPFGTPFAVAVGLATSLALAAASYRWIEMPAQSLGRRLGARIEAKA
jgi:peptidoglycan/LPS O-acetylase OafA/YrhL